MDLIEQIENGWPENCIINVDAAAVTQIPRLRKLKDSGVEFRWVQPHRLRDLAINGWHPVVDRHAGHDVIYKNRTPTSVRAALDLILVMREANEFTSLSTSSGPI